MPRLPAVRFFDAHNHLQDERLGDAQDRLLDEARARGVAAMVVNGACEEDWPAVAALAARHPEVRPAYGYHPWYMHERSARWREELRARLTRDSAASVGEIGLDRWIFRTRPENLARHAPMLVGRELAGPAEQEEAFLWQWDLAVELDRPASIHCLEAWGRFHDLIRERRSPRRGFLLHSYGGPAEMIGPLARLGAYFGFPGFFLHARKERHRETFRRVPADRLLVETDAPDQRLPKDAGERGDWPGPGCDVLTVGQGWNHPANLPAVYAGLAWVRGEPLETLAATVEANFARLFGAGGF
jgi:TatD DNase family protein